MSHGDVAGEARLSRLGLCGVCSPSSGPERAKYRCPKCSVTSCSLECSRLHKQQEACNGQRDEAQFVARSRYGEVEMMCDYRFLEKVGSSLGAKSPVELGVGPVSQSKRQRIGKKLGGLKTEARKRGIRLQLMPAGMARHDINTSSVRKPPNTNGAGEQHQNMARRVLHWRVEVYVDECLVPFTFDYVAEDSPISSLIAKVRQMAVATKNGQNLSGLEEFYLRGERCHAAGGGAAYWKLDQDQSLGEALVGKFIIEYPTFFLSSLKERFPPPTGQQNEENVASVASGSSSSDAEEG